MTSAIVEKNAADVVKLMIARVSNYRMTPEEYLALEAKSSIKHEYIDGVAYAMTGTTGTHNTISLNVAFSLRTHLRGAGCNVYMSDVKAQLSIRNNYYYPDVIVTCDPADMQDDLSARFPKLIVEVLSDSTEKFDRGDKFFDYQSFESLEEYVLINTRHKRVEVFRRAEGKLWLLQIYKDNDDIPVEFKSVGLSMSLTDIYLDAQIKIAEPDGES